MNDDTPAPAATIVLLRDKPTFEVLMIARHENSAFAGGALVFPGGRVDPADADGAWAEHARGLSKDARLAAAQIAAIREAFEETGVLLARTGDGAMASGDLVLSLSDMRADVERDGALFMETIKGSQLKLACDELRLFSHWVAPPGLHRRFDTLFFAANFPAGQQVIEDGAEATESLWIAPQKAIEARRAGARKIIFPTARNLELLGVSKSAGEVFQSALARDMPPIMPQVVTTEGEMWLTIPEGLGYPVTREPLALSGR